MVSPMVSPTQVSWKNDVNGVWSNANNWSGGAVPGATNAVLLDTLLARTVTFASGTGTIYSINAVTDALSLTGGTLTVLNNAVFSAGLALSGNATDLVLDGATASVAGAFTPSNGYIILGGATTLSVSGPATLGDYTSGTIEIDFGTLSTSNTTTIVDSGYGSYAQLYLGGGRDWVNTGTVLDGGEITGGDGNGATASFVNAAGAVFNFTSDDGSIINGTVYGISNAGSSTFSNAGTLEKIGGNGGVSAIYSVFTNTGLVNVEAGTVAFDGGGVFGGTLTGAGDIIFGGNCTLTAGTVFNAAGFETIYDLVRRHAQQQFSGAERQSDRIVGRQLQSGWHRTGCSVRDADAGPESDPRCERIQRGGWRRLP
jgi:hypothetical protein